MINYLSASALDPSFNMYILAALKRLFLAKCKRTFTFKKKGKRYKEFMKETYKTPP